MTSRRYFFNRGIIRQDLRQHSWILAVYLLGLLFGLPLQMLLNADPDEPARAVTTLFEISGPLQLLFTATIPVAAGMLLIRYLHQKGAADAAHALPLRREHLLAGHLVSGCILLLVPVWLTVIMAGAMSLWDGNPYLYGWTEALMWGLTISILTLFLFAFTAFAGICLGLTVLQGIVVYVLLILPAVLSQMIIIHLNQYLYGYPEFGVSGMDNWSPVLHMLNINGHPFKGAELGIYAILAAVFTLLSFLLYRKRHSETAGQAIAFTYFNPLFKAGVMLCAMLFSGTYFAQMRPGETAWTIAGYLAGAVIGYAAAEMVIRKSWQIVNRKQPLRFIGYTAVLGLLLYLPVSPLTGYETKIPAADQIEGVYAGGHYWEYFQSDSFGTGGTETVGNPFEGADPYSADPDYIASVRRLHEALVQSRPEEETRYEPGRKVRSVTLVYELRGGKRVTRQYNVPVAGFEPELRSVMESKEYKDKEYILTQLDKPISQIALNSAVKNVTIAEADQTEFKELLKEEIRGMTFEEQISDDIPLANIQVFPEESIGRNYYFSGYDWKPSFRKLGAWMKAKGYTDRIVVQAEDVKSAELIGLQGLSVDHERRYDPSAYFEAARARGTSVNVQDNALISDILNIRQSFEPTGTGYAVLLNYKNGNSEYFRLGGSERSPGLRKLLP